MEPKRTKIILATATVVVLVLVASAVAEFYPLTIQPTAKPFSFSLTVIPDNGAIAKGGNVTISVGATYLNGTSQSLMLSASGGPNGTTYAFSPQTGAPTKTNDFTSNLTVSVPSSTASGGYAINITAATADGKTDSVTYTLTVLLDSEVQVTGMVTTERWSDMYPTKIVFINVNTEQTYSTEVDTTHGSQGSGGLVQTGTYNITLPNQQIYRVVCCWTEFAFTAPPESGHSSGGAFEPMWLNLNCGPGVNTLIKNYTDKDAGWVFS